MFVQDRPRDSRIMRELRRISKEDHLKQFYDRILNFEMTPKQIKQYLDRFVIGQEVGKRTLSVEISFHYKRIAELLKKEMQNAKNLEEAMRNARFIKRNILMIGPTGVGKTYSLETLSRLIDLPIVIEDLTKFSATGYVGRDLEEIGVDLLARAEMNPFLAQVGIVYLDEIDKIARTPYTVGKDVNALEVQYGLLKLVEGTTYAFPLHLLPNVQNVTKEFSTKYVLFVGGGVFEGLKERVEKRAEELNKSFSHWSEMLTTDDLVEFGMERQLMGRFPVRVVYDDLTIDDLVEIMKRCEESPLKQYQEDFKAWGFELKFEEDAYRLIAEHAKRQRMGARGLVYSLYKVLLPYMYELPGEKPDGPIIIDAQIVKEMLE